MNNLPPLSRSKGIFFRWTRSSDLNRPIWTWADGERLVNAMAGPLPSAAPPSRTSVPAPPAPCWHRSKAAGPESEP